MNKETIDGRVRLAVICSVASVACLALACLAVWSLQDGQQRILAQVTHQTVHATRTLRVEWTCRDGETIHFEATSESNEPRDIFFSRFDADVAAREKDHPRR